jgi:flavodoxin
MKVLIVYESKFRNGEKIVNELANILTKKGHEIEKFHVKEARLKKDFHADLYVFSSPVRMFMLPLQMKRFLKRFKPSQEGAPYALMTTYLDPKASALDKMEAILKNKKMVKKFDSFKAKVNEIKGPLEEGYLDVLEEFAEKISAL